jgi:hypothetical protein
VVLQSFLPPPAELDSVRAKLCELACIARFSVEGARRIGLVAFTACDLLFTVLPPADPRDNLFVQTLLPFTRGVVVITRTKGAGWVTSVTTAHDGAALRALAVRIARTPALYYVTCATEAIHQHLLLALRILYSISCRC